MLEDIEERLEGFCPCCGKKRDFTYLGMQDLGKGNAYPLYHCTICETSISKRMVLGRDS